MWIAKNNDIIILVKDTREELEQALQFMVYTSIENSDLDYTLHNGKYITKEELTTLKKEQFNKDFFKTSLGYIRRKVSMATGETKDFLSDLLPSISLGLQINQNISVITYKEPDFTKETIDWEALQEVKTIDENFVKECFIQLNNDF